MVEQGRCRHFSVSELANVSNKAPHGCEPLRSRISKAKELLPKEQLRCQERRLGQPTPGINDYLGESYKAYVFLVGEVRIVSSFEHQSIKLGKILAIINLAQVVIKQIAQPGSPQSSSGRRMRAPAPMPNLKRLLLRYSRMTKAQLSQRSGNQSSRRLALA